MDSSSGQRVKSSTGLPGRGLDMQLTPSMNHAVVDARQLVFKTSSLALLKAKGVNIPGTYFPDNEMHEMTGQSAYLQGAKMVLDYMNQLFREQKLCDILIPVKQGELRAHKIALGAYSDSLAEKFASFPPEEVMCLDLTDFEYNVVHNLLHFLYTTEIELTYENAGLLYHCATELGINVLVQICLNFLNSFTVEGVLMQYEHAITYGLEDIRVSALAFIRDHFDEICNSPSFLLLGLDKLIIILYDDNICTTELAVFQAIVKWVSYDMPGRLPLAPTLLRCVRFQMISPEDLVTKVESVSFIFEPRECHDILYEAMKYHAVKLSGSPLVKSFEEQKPRAAGYNPSQLSSISGIKSRGGSAYKNASKNNHSGYGSNAAEFQACGSGMPSEQSSFGVSFRPLDSQAKAQIRDQFSPGSNNNNDRRNTGNRKAIHTRRATSYHLTTSSTPASLSNSPRVSPPTVQGKPGKIPPTKSSPLVLTVNDLATGQERNPRIAVIGAGAVGLSSAVKLQEELPNAEVTIIADGFNECTLSDGAAGIFRPAWDKTLGPNDDVLRQWSVDSFSKYDSLLHSDIAAEAGISMLSGYQFSHAPVREPLLIDGIVYHLRKCTPEDFQVFPCTDKYKYGYAYTTVTVESKWYLPFLTKTFLKEGGIVVNRTIENMKELIGEYDVVVNCTGLRAKELVDDDKVYAVRGQMERVRAPWLKHFVFDVTNGTWVLPCRDTVVIGGTMQVKNENLAISQSDKEQMVSKVVKLIPSLKKAEFQWTWVGLRPFRDPIRVEKETMKFGNQSLKVVHNYGHGGHGIALSWGTACHAALLAQELLQEQ